MNLKMRQTTRFVHLLTSNLAIHRSVLTKSFKCVIFILLENNNSSVGSQNCHLWSLHVRLVSIVRSSSGRDRELDVFLSCFFLIFSTIDVTHA
jgi:hypothetical protein